MSRERLLHNLVTSSKKVHTYEQQGVDETLGLLTQDEDSEENELRVAEHKEHYSTAQGCFMQLVQLFEHYGRLILAQSTPVLCDKTYTATYALSPDVVLSYLYPHEIDREQIYESTLLAQQGDATYRMHIHMHPTDLKSTLSVAFPDGTTFWIVKEYTTYTMKQGVDCASAEEMDKEAYEELWMKFVKKSKLDTLPRT